MIYCNIEDLKSHFGYSKNMDQAIRYILEADLNELPAGKTEIEGNKLYVNKVVLETGNKESLKYEEHHKYIDIHIDLIGDESNATVGRRTSCVQPYDDKADCSLYSYIENDSEFRLGKNRCAVYFPHELHMPGIRNTSDTVMKCIFKILDESLK